MFIRWKFVNKVSISRLEIKIFLYHQKSRSIYATPGYKLDLIDTSVRSKKFQLLFKRIRKRKKKFKTGIFTLNQLMI